MYCPPIMENQVDKKMENSMKLGGILGQIL